jgi:large subunit ribosomal protein L1
MVRGAAVLPHGTGKSIRVLVIAKGDKAKEAQAAGADFVGAEDMIEKIGKENWFEFDSMVATPDMMGLVGRIGRVLGPKGLMPNPKVGTVTPGSGQGGARAQGRPRRVPRREGGHRAGAVRQDVVRARRSSRRTFAPSSSLLIKLKPSSAKGTYMRSITISSTHGPGIKIDPTEFMATTAKA